MSVVPVCAVDGGKCVAYKGQNFLCDGGVGLLLGVVVQSGVERAEFYKEAQLVLDFRKGFHAALDKFAHESLVEVPEIAVVNPRRSVFRKGFGGHFLDVQAVEPSQLLRVENTGTFVDAADVKLLFQFGKRHLFGVVLGAPAEQRDVVDNGVLEETFFDKVLVTGVAVALA